MDKQFNYTNSKGKTYYLFTKEVIFRGGRKQRIRFFSLKNTTDGDPCELPAGYSIYENPNNGFICLKKEAK